jgi:O-methyltransferase
MFFWRLPSGRASRPYAFGVSFGEHSSFFMRLLPPSSILVRGLLKAKHGTLARKLNLLRCLRRNLKAVTSASGLLEQLFMITKLLNLEVPGVVVECGTYKGGSAVNLSLACELVDRRLLVYDSFSGLPKPSENDRTHSTIDGMTDDYEEGWWRGSLDEVKSNIGRYGRIQRCSFVPGYFHDTLPKLNEPVALAFCDVDLADSLRTCLKYLWPRLVEGGVLFTHEAMQREIFSIFHDDEWWRRNLGCAPPGLVGGGSGLGLYPTESGYYGSCLGYTVKSPQVVWARRIAGVESAADQADDAEVVARGSGTSKQSQSRPERILVPTKSDRVKVLYIVGSHRCGSTLLARLLGDLPGFFAVGEALLHFFGGSSRNLVPCGCGLSIQDCSFWKGISRPVDQVPFGARWLRLRRIPFLRSYCRRHPQQASELISSVSSFYDAIALRSGAKIIVDSSKSPLHAILLSWVPNVDLHVVYLVRDPRSIVASSRQPKEWIPETSPLRTTKRWLLVTLGTEYLRTCVPKWRILRYEDFVKAPRSATLQIAADLGYDLVETPFIAESMVELGPQHMLGSNPDKLKRGPTRIAEKSASLPWRSKVLVSMLTAPLLFRYGYWGEARRDKFQALTYPEGGVLPQEVAVATEAVQRGTEVNCDTET